MEEIAIRLVGTTPLIVKSDRTVDPFDSYSMRIREIADKGKKKTESDVRMMRRLEWEAGFYFDQKLGPFVPGWNLIRSLRDGAALSKKGRDVLRGVICGPKLPIQYDGPRDFDRMYESGRFIDVRRIVNKGGGGATMRSRPRFDDWALDVVFEFDEEVISRADLLASLDKAGRFAGLGEYRPSAPKGGQFGRYAIESVDGKKVRAAA